MSAIIKFSRLSAVVLLGGAGVGCMNAPLKQGLPAQQAMTQAYAQLFNTANYQFSGQMKVDQMDISPSAALKKQTVAEGDVTGYPNNQVEKQAYIDAYLTSVSVKADKSGKPLSNKQLDNLRQLAEQEAEKAFGKQPDQHGKAGSKPDSTLNSLSAAEANAKADSMIYEMMKAYSQRYRFNYSGVVDLRHKKLELTPEFRYEARNVAGYIRVPMLFDVADAKIYADLSALSPWFVNANSEGKYTRFDLKKHQEKVDVNRAFELLSDTALAGFQMGEQGSFTELAVTTEDRTLGARRKIQFESPLSHYIAKLAAYVAINKESFQEVLLNKPTDGLATPATSPEKTKPAAVQLDASAMNSLLKNQPEMYNEILAKVEEKVATGSTFRQEALLDGKGRVIQSRWQAYLVTTNTDKYDVKLKLSNQVNFSKYGSAAVSYQPKDGNWVDLTTSTEGSLFSGILGKNFFGATMDEYNRKVKEKKALEKNAQGADK